MAEKENTLDTALLDILRCPDEHHAELTYDAAAQTLTCTECRRIFPIQDGIPVLLLDEAITPDSRPDTGPDSGPDTGPDSPAAKQETSE